ncbi:hypothetical protein OG275_10810 [Streptomyces niveus]|nr:hypothetical protein [Streptomyces niveus]
MTGPHDGRFLARAPGTTRTVARPFRAAGIPALSPGPVAKDVL